MEPAIFQHLGGGLGVVVVAHHHPRALYAQLAHVPLPDGDILLVHNLDFPAVAGHADGPYLVDIVHPQVDAARAGGLGQAVVGVVLVVGEVLQPVLDEGGGHRLGADVHQPPLGQLKIFDFQVAPVQGG